MIADFAKARIRAWGELRSTVGASALFVELDHGGYLRVQAEELPLGGDECFQMAVNSVASRPSELVFLDLPSLDVVRLLILRRDEWLEDAGSASNGIIGENPRMQKWGPVGSAPPTALAKATVICGVVLEGENGRVLLRVSDYPALVQVTADREEMASFMATCTVAEALT